MHLQADRNHLIGAREKIIIFEKKFFIWQRSRNGLDLVFVSSYSAWEV